MLKRLFCAATAANGGSRRTVFDLAFERFEKATPQKLGIEKKKKLGIFTHGILGNKRNWRTPCNILGKSTGMLLIAADHRGHGGSHDEASKGNSEKNSVQTCAQDLDRLICNNSTEEVPLHLLCGHSFGGKVTLKYLQSKATWAHEELPEDVWILDCLPGTFDDTAVSENSSESVGGIFDILRGLPLEFADPADVVRTLIDKGISLPIAQWLTSNCRPAVQTPGEYRLGFDLDVATDLFHSFCQEDFWAFIGTFDGKGRAPGGRDCTVHFLRAGRNPLWTQPDEKDKPVGRTPLERMEGVVASNTSVKLHTMPNVGHWMHAEDARGLLKVIQTESSAFQ